jgi:hypothetical protein
MKLLFLDFDGVLTSIDSIQNRHKITGKYEPITGIHDQHVKLLNGIVERTDCKIVISSVWRTNHEIPWIRGRMMDRGFLYPRRVYRQPTPYFAQSKVRGLEIQKWIDDFGKDLESICILDDSDDMHHLSPFLVRTSGITGLTKEIVEKVVDVLNSHNWKNDVLLSK